MTKNKKPKTKLQTTPRNPLANHPLMCKGGVHEKTESAKRAAEKRKIKKQADEWVAGKDNKNNCESNQDNNIFYRLTEREGKYCEALISNLEEIETLAPLISEIQRVGITRKSMPFLFELRFAKMLVDRGITPEYEFPTLGGQSVDFKFTAENQCAVLAELVSINPSDAVREATRDIINQDGVHSQSLLLKTDNKDTRFSGEGEIILVQQKICEKIFDKENSQPKKFEKLNQSNKFNLIVVDTRGVFGGSGVYDKVDCEQLCYGNNFVDEYEKIYWKKNGDQTPIFGLFEEGNRLDGVKTLLERIHGILFTWDTNYEDGSLLSEDSSFLACNPYLINSQDKLQRLRTAVLGSEDSATLPSHSRESGNP